VGATGIEAVSATAAALVKGAADVGDDVGRTARNAVEGAIKGARDVGITSEQAASAAASGAMTGAGEINSAALDQVRDVVTRTISGIRVVITEPLRTNQVERYQDRVE
jgi:hypothetical protein